MNAGLQMQEAAREVQLAAAVIPTPVEETKMSTTVPQSTVTKQQQEAVDRLNALDPGDSVNNGVHWYESAGPGLWSVDPDSKSAEVLTSLEIVLAATKAIEVDRASNSIALPAKAVEPSLARFKALAGDEPHPWILPAGSADPSWRGTCPAWCEVDSHEVEVGYGSDQHRSRPIAVLYSNGYRWECDGGRVGISHFEVALERVVSSRDSALAWVTLAREHRGEGTGTTLRNARLAPAEARQLARALLAAADLADPDGDFYEAGQ